jgi:hypothetical protein
MDKKGILECLTGTDFTKHLISIIEACNKRDRDLPEKNFEEVRSQMQLQLTRIAQLEKAISDMKLSTQSLKTIVARDNQVIKQSQLQKLRISGLCENEDEDLTLKIKQLVTEELGVPLKPGDIISASRIPRPPQRRLNLNDKQTDKPPVPPRARMPMPRQIILTLSSYWVRNSIYRARVQLRNTGIYINEDLDTETVKLFFLARKMRNNGMIQSAWTSDLKVQIRAKLGQDPITITSEEELKKYDQGEIPSSTETTLNRAMKLKRAGVFFNVYLEDRSVTVQSTKSSDPISIKDLAGLVDYAESLKQGREPPRQSRRNSPDDEFAGFTDLEATEAANKRDTRERELAHELESLRNSISNISI